MLCFGCILFLGIFCIFYTSFLIPDAKDQQQNQQNQDQKQNKQDQKQDDKQQSKDQQEQNKKDQQNPQQPQQNQNQMSKENAEQLLNAAMQDEKNVQDKVKKQIQVQGRKLEKDW